ncbi:MAG: hypothetical protein MJ211_00350 [Bacteroidales bacterium]|nr:hypothetical protein [Bacteroidales bacterium]
MKIVKFFVVAIMLLTFANTANSQIRFDAQAGWASPQGEAFSDCAKGGLGYSLDLMYVPSFLDGQLSIGIAKDGNILFGASKGDETASIDFSASKLGLIGGKIRFDLKSPVVKPYAAITMGVGRLKVGNMKSASLGGLSLGNDDEFEFDPVTKFAIKPEIGVAFGHFTIGIGWMLPAEYEVEMIVAKETYKAGVTQFNIGLSFGGRD